MERLMPAQTSEPSKEIHCYQYFSSKGSRNGSIKLSDLGRNVLIVICEYLTFFEIVMLTAANKRIKKRLDNFQEKEPSQEVSYFKRRAIINFQSFFFDQFPCTEVFYKRMSSITSSSTMASSTNSSFLPLTKQSSLCYQSTKTLPIFSKQLSQSNPFEMAMDAGFHQACKKQLLEKIDDNKSSNYIEETYIKWRELYLKAFNNKQMFLEQTRNEFYSSFVQEPDVFAREIFLDPSLCENPTFALPQLTRETFTQKGLFYRTEKILVQGFQNCFAKYSVEYSRQILWELNDDMQNLYLENENFQTVIQTMLRGKMNKGVEQSQSTTFTSSSQMRQSSSQYPQCSYEDVDMRCENKSRSEILNNLMPDPLDIIDFNENCEDELELALASLQNLQMIDSNQKAKQASVSPFEHCVISVKQPKDSIAALYMDICTYTLRQTIKSIFLLCDNFDDLISFLPPDIFYQVFLIDDKDFYQAPYRQFQLLCNAHNQQLNFILQQINMAPPQKQNLYIYMEDYIYKEKNLRYLLKKITQNFVVQESFSETLLRNSIVSQNDLNKHPYYCDFMLLELLDSIWINETYRKQKDNLLEIAKKEIAQVHSIDRIHELIEKKETFRKVINLIHQMEANIENEAPFLTATNISQSSSDKSDNQAISCHRYKDLELHLRKIVRQMLKQMQRCSQSVSDFVQLCQQYESYEFHKIQELEYFYIVTKKHYLAKAFCQEFSTRLENNKFSRSSVGSGGSGGSTSGMIATMFQQHSFMDLNINQIIPYELINSFFHQLVRNLMKEEKFKEFMESDQLMQSLFVIFHIDQQSKNQFTFDLNHLMVAYHQQMDELRTKYPELYGDEHIIEEIKQSETMSEKVGYFSPALYNSSQSGPFTLIGKFTIIDFNFQTASDEDDDYLIEPIITPELNRGYSDQKKQYQKGFRNILFQVFQKTEEGFDFKNMINKMRQEEHKRMVEQLQASINNFNQTLQQRGQQQQQTNQNVNQQQQQTALSQTTLPSHVQHHLPPKQQQTQQAQATSQLMSLPDLDDFDEEDLPDPSTLMGTFSTNSGIMQSQSLTNEMQGNYSNNLLIGPGMGGLNNLVENYTTQHTHINNQDYIIRGVGGAGSDDLGMNIDFQFTHNSQNNITMFHNKQLDSKSSSQML